MTGLKEKVFGVIAQEVNEPPEEICNNRDLEFADLGIDKLLAECILNRLRKINGLDLPSGLFEDCSTVGSLIDFLENIEPSLSSGARPPRESNRVNSDPQVESREALPEQPLSIRLQGSSKTATKTVFLLPDGAGSAMSYARIPSLGSNICLYGLNSPFLSQPEAFLPIPAIAPIWAAEIRRLQPRGPYILGGWSAGGYYCFELAKYLIHNATEDDGRPVKVEKLILIDSPCRVVFEALPMVVVNTLARQGLIGTWGAKGAPKWLLNHFSATIAQVEEYQPSPLIVPSNSDTAPKVFVLWATNGVYPPGGAARSGLDLNTKVTRFMLEDRHDFGPNGWDTLFPKGTQMAIARTPGTHFSLVFPPNSSHIASCLKDIVLDDPMQRSNAWDYMFC